MASERGPVPKRSDQRRRRNKTEPVDQIQAAGEVEIPTPDEGWHPIAAAWYGSLRDSAQSVFYEPSDWATAHLIAESMSRDLNPQFVAVTEKGDPVYEKIPLKGASLSAYLKAMNALLVTEGDRRRMRLEIERGAKEESKPEVAELDEFRNRRSG